MDLSFIHFPELFAKKDLYQLVSWTKYSVKNASKIFTISKSSKDDIIDIYGVEDKKVIVTYPGIKEGSSAKILTMDDLRKKFGIDKDYILFVGTLQPRKNISKLIEAFSKLKESRIKLVIVGKKGWLYEPIFEKVKELKVEGRVKFLDFIPQEEMPSLYKGAKAFILPSLYEGFGMPPVEAQAVGVPVVVSRLSSLPEVVGASGIYIDDPHSIDSIKEALEKVISLTKNDRQAIIEVGKENTKRFDWDLSAAKLLTILHQVARK